MGRYGDPKGVLTVAVEIGSGSSRLTIVRHGCTGENQYGQSAAAYPYALVNMPAWRDLPFDLHIARWYEGREATVESVTRDPQPSTAAPEARRYTARFAQAAVELRRDGPARWVLYVAANGKRFVRQPNVSSPFLDHAKRCAEYLYGEPIDAWTEAA